MCEVGCQLDCWMEHLLGWMVDAKVRGDGGAMVRGEGDG